MKRILTVATASAALVVGAPATSALAATTDHSPPRPPQHAPQHAPEHAPEHAPDRHDGHGQHDGHGRHDGHRATVSDQDTTWLENAAAGDLFEIQGGKLALQRATHEATRQYARRLIRDHTAAYAQKQAIAAVLGLRVPDAPTGDLKAELRDLKSAHGSAFDKKYLQTEVDDHGKDISDTKDEIDSGRHPLVVSQAKRELPVLKTHLDLGRRTLSQIHHH